MTLSKKIVEMGHAVEEHRGKVGEFSRCLNGCNFILYCTVADIGVTIYNHRQYSLNDYRCGSVPRDIHIKGK